MDIRYGNWTADRAEVTGLAVIDLDGCIDAIDHDTLIKKLKLLRISSGCLKATWAVTYKLRNTIEAKPSSYLK